MNNYTYPAIIPLKKNGNEIILGVDNAHLLDFWQWAYSDLMNNSQRGIFAEWLVAKALNAVNETRTEWDKYDILTSDNIKVEVKASAYLQSWNQNELSKIIFSIRPTYGWDKNTNLYDDVCKRQSDVYVFCVHNHTDMQTINPLDISQWDFYVISTGILNSKVPLQKSISLSALIKLGAVKSCFNDLNRTVTKIVGK